MLGENGIRLCDDHGGMKQVFDELLFVGLVEVIVHVRLVLAEVGLGGAPCMLERPHKSRKKKSDFHESFFCCTFSPCSIRMVSRQMRRSCRRWGWCRGCAC